MLAQELESRFPKASRAKIPHPIVNWLVGKSEISAMVSKFQVPPISKRPIIQTLTATAVFAVAYRFWLAAPVLQYVSIGGWRLFAIVIAAAFGGALSLLRVPMFALSCGAMAGLLLGGTWAAWKAPNDVAISVYAAFVTHLESFWRQMLILTFAATLGATVPILSKDRVKASAKAIAIIAISLFAFALMALAYSTARGYTSWFFRVWHPVITVNGIRSEGWLQKTRDGNRIFLTEHSSGQSVTYDLVFTDSGNGHVLSCGAWVAPRWPAILIGDVNPPCFFLGYAGHGLTRGTNSVSFTTLDGRKLQVDW